MKGRFRKGKKAFNNDRRGKLSSRYMRFLVRVQNERKTRARFAMKALLTGMVAGSSRIQLALINAQQGVDKIQKALAIKDVEINTAKAINNIYNAPTLNQ